MERESPARAVFYIAAAFAAIAAVFLAGLYSGSRDTAIRRAATHVVASVHLMLSEADTLSGRRPVQWTEPRRHPGDGVTVNTYPAGRGGHVLLQSFLDDGLEIRLIDRAGELINRWPLEPFELIDGLVPVRARPVSDWNFNTHGMAILADGSIVFNIDHHGLVKLDRCGSVVWKLAEPTHHAVTFADDGSLWVPGTRRHGPGEDGPHPLFPGPVAEDTLLHVGADGRVLDEISVLESLLASDETGLLTLGGGAVPGAYPGGRPDHDREVFHLNDVEPLPAAFADRFPMFVAGDLLVSLRNRNALLVIDPRTRAIKWSLVGDWSRQHDPDWLPDGRIAVYDNARDGTVEGQILGSSRIVAVDPRTGSQEVLYGDAEHFFHSTRRGKQQVLPDGRILITEAEAGRVLEVDERGGLLWSFVNGFDAEHTLNVSEAIAVAPGFFDDVTWACDV